MNCNQAKQLLDERVQALSECGDNAPSESAQLRAHLAACAACAKEYEELLCVRDKLATLSEDAPSDVELHRMWRTISPSAKSQSMDDKVVSSTRRPRRVLRYAAIITSIAAVLMISLRLGQWRYDEHASPTFSSWYSSTSAARTGVRPYVPSVVHRDEEAAPTSDRQRRSRSVGVLDATETDEDVPAQNKQRRLAGFESFDKNAALADASSTEMDSVTRAFWDLIRNGDATAQRFVSPSANGPMTEDFEFPLDSVAAANGNTVSYGYELPFGPSPTQPREGVDNRQVLAADRGPFYSTQDGSRSAIDGSELPAALGATASAGGYFILNSGFEATPFADGYASYEHTETESNESDGFNRTMAESLGEANASQPDADFAFGQLDNLDEALGYATFSERVPEESGGRFYLGNDPEPESVDRRSRSSRRKRRRMQPKAQFEDLNTILPVPGEASRSDSSPRGIASTSWDASGFDGTGFSHSWGDESDAATDICREDPTQLNCAELPSKTLHEFPEGRWAIDGDGITDLVVSTKEESTEFDDQLAGNPNEIPSSLADVLKTPITSQRLNLAWPPDNDAAKSPTERKTGERCVDMDDAEQRAEELVQVYNSAFLQSKQLAEAFEGFYQQEEDVFAASPRDDDSRRNVADAGLSKNAQQDAALQERQTESAAPQANDTAQVQTAPPIQRPKVIKTGELSSEVDDYKKSVTQAEAIVARFGGIVADTTTREQTGGALSGRLVVRVAPEQFDPLFAALRAIGRLESESIKVADVTAEYVDIEARIHSLSITEQRLQDLIKHKTWLDNINALLEVEREVTRIRTQIEQLEGRIRVMNDRIAMSTITVNLSEPARIVPSATLSIEVAMLDDAAKALGEALAHRHGRLTSGKTSNRDNGTLAGNYELEVSLTEFDAMLGEITMLGRVADRQVSDRQFGDATAPWAAKAKCRITLAMFEQSRQLPSGWIKIEVADAAAAVAQLESDVAGAGASIVSNVTKRQDDGSSTSELNVRVPAGSYARLIDVITPLGRTTGRNIAGEAGRVIGGAAKVLCDLAVTLAEPARQLPGGWINLEVDDLAAARGNLDGELAARSAKIVSNVTTRRDDGSNIAELSLRVPAGSYSRLMAAIATLGRVTGKNMSNEAGRFVGTAADAPCDIKLTLAEPPREVPSGRIAIEVASFGAARDRLSKLIADTGAEVMASTSSRRTDGSNIGRFRVGFRSAALEDAVERIEALGHVVQRDITGVGLGDLSRVDADTLGVLDIMLGERATLSPGREQTSDSLRSRVRDGLKGLYTSLGLIVYGLTVMLPWLILLGGVAWFATRSLRKRRQNRTSEKKNPRDKS